MITLQGTYANTEQHLEYVCRVIPYHGDYYSPIGQYMIIEHGDVLYMLGKATWFALYQTPERKLKTLEYLANNAVEHLNTLPIHDFP